VILLYSNYKTLEKLECAITLQSRTNYDNTLRMLEDAIQGWLEVASEQKEITSTK